MTREQFSALARKVSIYAAAHPRQYRLKVALWAALGYGVLVGAIGLSIVVMLGFGNAIAQPWFWNWVGRDVRIAIVTFGLIFAMASFLFSLIHAFFMRWPLPLGRRLSPNQAPRLFALIDEVLKASGACKPHAIIGTWEFNACIVQRPRFGWLGPSRDYLVIGLPLMAALSVEELKAVIAHEFAHLRGQHGRFGNWIWRLRIVWQQVVERFGRDRRKIGLLFRKFAVWYAPHFNAYSFALAREQEFQADLCSSEIAGAETAARALVKVALLHQRLKEQFWQKIDERARQESAPPKGLFTLLVSVLREPSTPQQRCRWLRTVLAAETEGGDSHPATVERLRRLGFSFCTALDTTEAIEAFASGHPIRGTALEIFLGECQAAEILVELENQWREVAAPAWQQRFDQAQMMRRRLDELKQQTLSQEPTEKNSWERTFLEVELAENENTRRAVLAEFISRWPHNASGHFVLGKRLLAEDDEAGIASIECATRIDARMSAEGEALVAAYLRRAGRWEEASARKIQSLRQADLLDASQRERHVITAKDTFLAHGLDDSEISELRDQLTRHPRVAKAWIVQKKVAHFPENPWYVLVCAVRWKWSEPVSRAKLEQILRELSFSLEIDGKKDFWIYVYGNHGRVPPIGKAVRKIAGAQIYPAPNQRQRWWKRTKPVAATPTPAVPAPRVLPPPLPVVPRNHPGRQQVAWTALIVSLIVVAIPLSYVGLQVTRSASLWMALLHHRAERTYSVSSKEIDAQRPIVINPNATTEEAEHRVSLAWAQRVMLEEGYDRAGSHDPGWDEAARQFISQALPWWANCREAPSARSLLPKANELLERGCDDPLVLFLIGKLKFDTDLQSNEAGDLLSRAVKGFSATHYSRAIARLAAEAFITDCDRRNDGTGQKNSADTLWLQWFEQQLRDGSFAEAEQGVLTKQFSRGAAERLFKNHCTKCAAILHGPAGRFLSPWACFYLIGKSEIAEGWKARGSGYANTVTAGGWRGFREHFAKARQNLVASWNANPRRPEAAAEMIEVAMGESGSAGESERLWLDRAVTAQFDFIPAYRSLFWAYRPRWGGSNRALLSLGEQCAKTQRYDTLVPMEFYFSVVFISQERDDHAGIFRDPSIFGQIEQVLTRYENEPSQRGRRACIQGHHARAAFQAGRFSEAYELLRGIDFELTPEVVAALDEGETPAAYLEQVAAFGSAGGAKTIAADQAVIVGKTAKALTLYREALQLSQTEPRAAHYIRSKLAAIELDEKLASGDWISFQPSAENGLDGWSTVLGSWKPDADGSLIGRSGANGFLLVNDAKVGPNFELRGEIDFLPGSTGEVQAGVAFGYPNFETYDWRSVRLRRQPDQHSEIILSQHWKAGPLRPVDTAEHNVFLVRSWRGKLTVILNERAIFQDELISDGFVKASNARVGLGAYAHQGNLFSVRYRNLQLRRLTTPPPLSPQLEIVTASNKK